MAVSCCSCPVRDKQFASNRRMDRRDRLHAAMNRPVDITALLEAWNQGDLEARDQLIPAVYAELRRRAAAFLRRERAGQTLQPTALVHEVYLRLVDQDRAVWQNRAQFLAVASEMMRRILVDRARAHKMAKRSGRWARVTLADDAARGTQRDVDVLDLNNALDELSAFDQRKARVAELRFFGGLSLEETGLVLGTSLATTMRDWQAARAWLFRRLTRGKAARNAPRRSLSTDQARLHRIREQVCPQFSRLLLTARPGAMAGARSMRGGPEMNKSKLCITSLVGAIVLVSAFTASPRAQKYSDWSAPINLGPTVNSASIDRGPAISKDGLSLYFASTRPGGFGGEDIYVSQRETLDSEWGPPVNLGPIINTTANEMVPAFSRDGHLLFFASSRLGGFGGVDIWVSRREHTHDDFAWQPAENLGAGVNSVSIDAGPSYFDNDEVGVPQLYFNSNRPGGPGILISTSASKRLMARSARQSWSSN